MEGISNLNQPAYRLTPEQLEGMSQTDINRAWKIVREKNRRYEEEFLRYMELAHPGMDNVNFPDIPVNDQRGFIHSTADIRAIFGGNRGMKTQSGAYDILKFCIGEHPVRSLHRQPPVYCRVCAPKYEAGCKGVILKKYREMLPHYHLRGSSWQKAWSEGSKTLHLSKDLKSSIQFLSYEMDLDAYGGADLDAWHMDEHGEEKYFRELMARITDRNGYGIMSMTPEAGITWEKDIIDNPPHGLSIEHWFFDTRGNPYLSKEGVEKHMATLVGDPKFFQAKVQGLFVALAGLVYPMYNPAQVMITDCPALRSKISKYEKHCIIDPHHRKFTAILWNAWSPEGECITYRTVKMKDTVEKIAQRIRAESAGERIDLWIGDEAMGGDGKNIFGQESVLAQLNELGLPFMGTNQSSDKSFEAGIMKVQEFLTPDPVSGLPSLRILDSLNTGLEHIDGRRTGSIFWEFGRYRYKKEQKSDEEAFREKVANVDDDYLDCLRYDLMAGASYGGGEVKISNPGRTDPITRW